MLGRRNLRIKVMQALYAWETDREIPLLKLEGYLKGQIQKSVTLYLTHLSYLIEVCQYSLVDKNRRLAKYIKTEEDEKPSTTIANNAIIQSLLQDEQFQKFAKKEGVKNYLSSEIVKSLFNELITKQKFKDYALLEKPALQEDKDLIQFILKKIFDTNKDLEHHLEEIFINYDDDNSLLLHIMGKYIDSFDASRNNNFFPTIEVWEEENQFALNLLIKTIQQNEELVTLIQPKLKNWEMDRVAVMDLILIKMAICEIKYFPTIPVKVSINEYIDISKMYSTPKSKDFVNGVLDKVKNEMLEKGEIKKFGRGLME